MSEKTLSGRNPIKDPLTFTANKEILKSGQVSRPMLKNTFLAKQ